MMKTTSIQKIHLSWLLGGMLVLATTGFAQEQAPLVSELLEEGVYQEEANGDLDAAITLYQQIVESEQVSRPKAAEAQYRLAVCYQKQGRTDLAVESFEALVENYPNQAEWVDAALEFMPKPFVPEDIPWVDGEVIVMEIRLPTGMVVGYNTYLTERIEREGRDLWRMTNRTLTSFEMITKVEIDPSTHEPVQGYFFGSNQGMGEVSWWFEDGQVRSLYGDNPEAKITPIEGPVIDNLQAQFLIRQFPVEVGFSTEQTIFAGMAGTLIPVTFTNLDISEIETPLGVFECIRTEIDLGVQKQYFWTTTDEARRVVKLEAGGVDIVVTRADIVSGNDLQTFRHDDLGFALDLPASWSVFNPPESGAEGDRTRIEIRDDGGLGTFSVTARRESEDEDNAELTPLEDVRAVAEKQIEAYRKRIASFEVDESSWQERELADGTGLSVMGHFTENGSTRAVKKVFLQTGGLVFVGTMRCPEDVLAENVASLEQIMAALRVD